MYLWNDLAEIPEEFGPSVVTIGNFDGVHRGHQQVLKQVVGEAARLAVAAVVISFDPHPAQVHRPESAPELIMGLPGRVHALAETGIDALLMMTYDLQLAENTPEEFVRKVFVDGLNASAVVIGHDVRFGKGNSGDLSTMRELGGRLGFDVVVVDEFGQSLPEDPQADDEGRRCSSTWVREALATGEVATAARVLGRPHRVRGEIVHGAERGRKLGFPTANLSQQATGMIPLDGVYAGWLVDAAGNRWPSAISVGSNPTFENVSRQVEAHVIDRPTERTEDFNLYGQMVVVEFVDRLRGMVAYKGTEALVDQMHRDVSLTRSLLSTDPPADR